MILLRHGQSEFNLHFTATRKDPGIRDPSLTSLGHEQAEAAADALASHGIRRLIVSPYTRTLQTAAPIARRLGLAMTVNPIVCERYAFTCDIGSPRAELTRAWPELDFSRLEEVWWPQATEPAAVVIARAAQFCAEMSALPDWSDTLVITHWGFIMALTSQSVPNGERVRADPTAPPPLEVTWRHH